MFRRVTVPLIAPSLGAGAVLCWARALGESAAPSPPPGHARHGDVLGLLRRETAHSAIALSLVLLAVSIVVLISLRDHWLRGGSAV